MHEKMLSKDYKRTFTDFIDFFMQKLNKLRLKRQSYPKWKK